MATGVYIGIGGKAKKVSKMYIGIGGVAKKIKKGYIGVGGVAKLFYNSQPVLGIAGASITLTGSVNADTCCNRGTVFNNRAILLGMRSSTQAKADTITASLTKTTITMSSAAIYASQCAKLPSYAVLGGIGRREGYDERKASLNSSFTVGYLTTCSTGTHKGGMASQTSSYALYLGTYKTYSGTDEDEDRAEDSFTAINNSLSMTHTAVSSLGGMRYYDSAVSLGDVVVFKCGSYLRTINNSLTRTSATPPTHVVWGSGTAVGPYAMFVTSTSSNTGTTAQPLNIYAFNSGLTATLAYTENSTNRWGIAAGSTPSAAVFVGGSRSGTYETTCTRVIALDSSFTDVSNGMSLTYANRDMQSCVLPFGSRAIFAGGCDKGVGVSTGDFYNKIYVVTEE